MLDNYPPGAALDPFAPYNQRERTNEEEDGCPNPGRRCKCDDCQGTMADLAYDEDR